MAEWNFMDYDSKDNLLQTIREEAATMLALAYVFSTDRRAIAEPSSAGRSSQHNGVRLAI